MHCDLSLEMDDLGRMEGRILSLFDRLRAKLVNFSSIRVEDRVLINATIEIEEQHLGRIESLAFKIEGMRHITLTVLKGRSYSAPDCSRIGP